MASVAVINLVTASGWLPSIILLIVGGSLTFLWKKNKKTIALVFGILSTVVGIAGLLHVTGIFPDFPFLTYGIPAVLSCYFDLFSGFVQAYVFTLLTMVYIAGSLLEPETAAAE
jgi:hypothetical protein